ncbi:PEP-utilizing enzyme [Patescibacteria group bacterium]
MPDLIKKYKLDQSSWTYKGFHGVLHMFFPVGHQGLIMDRFFGHGSSVTLFVVKDNYIHWYWKDDDLDNIRNVFFSRLKKDPQYLSKLHSKWKSALNRFEAVIGRIHKKDLSKLSQKQLVKAYNEFYQRYIEEYSFFMNLGDAVSMHADRYVIPEFKRILGEDFTKVFPQLMTTSHNSFLEKEQDDRKKLITIIKKQGTIDPKQLDAHSKKYFYISNNYARGKYLIGKDFLSLIKKEINKKDQKAGLKSKAPISKTELIKKYQLSHWHKTLLSVMEEFFYIQDTRKKHVLISNYYQQRFLDEAQRRTMIPMSLLAYTVFPEYKSVLQSSININELKKRKEFCLCVQTKKAYTIYTDSQARNVLKFLQDDQESIKDITGIVASSGKVNGRVRIIMKIHDMINMEEGDVLVSSMTRPEMLPAMKKASAIVTDEGGLTCHAAIVAREMRIPCIIGTKIATHALKDGDMVEVDAQVGTVKKL